MLRLLANAVIAFFVIWTLAVSVAEFIGVTIHFPWVIAGVDEIPLSRPKKIITRDFADGVLMAEIVNHYCPKLVDLHNYSNASSVR